MRLLPGGTSAAVTAVAVSLLGAPIGLIWATLAPAPAVVISPGGADFANPEANTFFAGDGYFLLIGLAVGLVCGAVAYRLRALHPLGALAGLTAGGIGAALVAGQVGERLHHGAFVAALAHAPVGAHLYAFVTVRAAGAYFAWPFAAVLAYGVAVAAFGGRRAEGPPAGTRLASGPPLGERRGWPGPA